MSYIGQRPVVGRYIKLDQISSGFNGSETNFSMTAGSQAVFPGTARNLLLSLGGVIQEPDTNFTISGSTLTFTTAPVANTTFFAVIFGDMQSTGTPSDGTVLPASIASSGNFSFPQLTVTGTSSLGDDVTFTGANYNVVWDKSANCLEFTDNAKAKFGTGLDLEIYHDGSESYITDGGTGDLYIQSSAIILEATNGENYFKGIANGAAQIYYDGVTKLQTTSTGVTVTAKTQIEGGSGDTELILKRTNTAGSNGNSFGTIKFNDENSNIIGRISTIRSTAADDGDITFAARPTGGSLTEYLRIKSTGNIQIPADNKYLQLGASQDLNLYHDGSHSYITNATGAIHIHGKSGENSIVAVPDGAVELYYDNSKKLETTSEGINVTKAVTIDGSTPELRMKVTGDEQSHRIRFFNTADSQVARIFGDPSTGNLSLQTGTNGAQEAVKAISNGAVELYHNNSKKFETYSNGCTVTGNLNVSSNVDLGDNAKARFGTSNDLQIFHDGTHSFIQDTGTGDLIIYGTGEDLAKFKDDGSVELYYDGSKKLETTSAGVQVTGALNVTTTMHIPDGSIGLQIGNSNDLMLYHDGTHSNIKNSTNQLNILGNDIRLLNNGASKALIKAFDGGAVELYHNGNLQVFTIDGGMNWQDNKKAEFGNSGDLKIYHDGTDNRFDSNGLKNMIFRPKDTDVGLKIIGDGGVELYYDNSKKFETTSTGIAVAGHGSTFSAGANAVVATFSSAFGGAGATSVIRLKMNTSSLHGIQMQIAGSATSVAGGNNAATFFNTENAKLRLGTNNVEQFRIENNGDLKGTDTSIGSLSDSRLKKNIVDFTYDLTKFKNLRPRIFDWINPELHGNKSNVRGFVAQEIETVDSTLVGNYELYDETLTDKNPDLAIIEADDGTNIAKDSKLGTNDAMYISVIQQMLTKIETLETKVAALEAA